MEKRDWVSLPSPHVLKEPEETHAKLIEMMNQLDQETGFRFTEEQAEAIRTIINGLVEQVKSFKTTKKAKRHLFRRFW